MRLLMGGVSKAARLADRLRAAGFAVRRVVESDDPQLEDDTVKLTQNVSVSVSNELSPGTPYMTVVREELDGNCRNYPLRSRVEQVLVDLRVALGRAAARPGERGR